MDRVRDELLAGAALAVDQNGRARLGDLVDEPVDLLHRRDLPTIFS